MFSICGQFVLDWREGREGEEERTCVSNYYLLWWTARPGHEVLQVTSPSCRLRSLNAIPCLALAEDRAESYSTAVSAASQYCWVNNLNTIEVFRLRLRLTQHLPGFVSGWWLVVADGWGPQFWQVLSLSQWVKPVLIAGTNKENMEWEIKLVIQSRKNVTHSM